MGTITGLELHEACTLGDYDTLEELLDTGKYDVDTRDPEWQNRAPIHWASSKGFVECLRLLLEHGANAILRMNMGWTPAHCAAEAGKVHVLRALHTAGVSVRKKDKYGDTPRRVAEVYGHSECVKYLFTVDEEVREKQAAAGQDADSDSELSDEADVTS